MTSDPTPAPNLLPPEVSRAQFAALAGLSSRAVADLAERGILVRAERKGRYQALPSLHAYLAHLRRMAQGRAGENGLDLASERANLTRIQAELEQLKLDERRGKVLTMEEVTEGWSRIASLTRSMVMAMPSRIRQAIPHLTGHDAQVLRSLGRELLEELAQDLHSAPVPGSSGGDELRERSAA